MKDRSWRGFLSVLLFLALFLNLCPAARAEDESPSISDRKGTAPADGPWLDRENYTDGSVYENPPTDVKFVRIGLCYGETAAEEAEFVNSYGNGFLFGVYDWQRNFVQYASTDSSCVRIRWSDEEEDGLVLLGEDDEVIYLSGNEATISVMPIAGDTVFRGRTYLGGFECRKALEQKMIVVNCVELEDYVKGVIPYEMANGWPKEALKAQAVCARTYVVYNQNAYIQYGFDLTDDTECQVYRGTAKANAWTDSAVDATRGQLVRYQGEICEVYYSAADGGATEDGINVFGSERPYLLGKPDPFERVSDYAYKSWQIDYDGEEISARLNRRGFKLGTIVDMIPEFSPMGNVIAITYVDEDQNSERIEGRRCYTVLSLPSCRFRISREEDSFIFDGSGLGHNCGMSQWGAKAMDDVYGYDYNDIIRFYFTGAYIA